MANQLTYTWDPGQYDISMGTQDVSGYADGSFIKIARNVEQANLVVGSDGDNTVVTSQNLSGTVTITLQQSSPLNDYFTSLALAFQNKTGGIVPFIAKDNNGTSKATAKQMWVKKLPDQENSKDLENREWVFETGNLQIFVGGTSLAQ